MADSSLDQAGLCIIKFHEGWLICDPVTIFHVQQTVDFSDGGEVQVTANDSNEIFALDHIDRRSKSTRSRNCSNCFALREKPRMLRGYRVLRCRYPTSTDTCESASMNRIEKLKNDLYSFEELDTLEKNAIKLRDQETLSLVTLSRASKKAKGEKPKSMVDANGVPLTKRGRRDAKAGRQKNP